MNIFYTLLILLYVPIIISIDPSKYKEIRIGSIWWEYDMSPPQAWPASSPLIVVMLVSHCCQLKLGLAAPPLHSSPPGCLTAKIIWLVDHTTPHHTSVPPRLKFPQVCLLYAPPTLTAWDAFRLGIIKISSRWENLIGSGLSRKCWFYISFQHNLMLRHFYENHSIMLFFPL